MSGRIVNIPQFQAAYNSAKAAVIHFVKSIAVEMVQFARANSVSPGYIATEISSYIPPETKAIWNDKIPMGRPGEPHELKGAYLYLASDISSYTTGSDIVVDGGYSLPWKGLLEPNDKGEEDRRLGDSESWQYQDANPCCMSQFGCD